MPRIHKRHPFTLWLVVIAVLISLNTYAQTTYKWIKITASGIHTLGLRSDNSLWGWGGNDDAQLGDSLGNASVYPVKIRTDSLQTDSVGIDSLGDIIYETYLLKRDSSWLNMVAGDRYSLAIRSDGTLWGWGYNADGQLGNGSDTLRVIPYQSGTSNNWVSIAAGNNHSLGLKSDGTLWAWGDNYYGELGDGTNNGQYNPIQIGTDNKWTKIVAGSNHNLALKSDSTLWTWGDNYEGQAGIGVTSVGSGITQIGINSKWIAIAAGFAHSLALKADGTLWAWGNNDNGQLGDGTLTQRTSPVQIGTDNRWVNIAAGYYHSLGIKSDSTLWGWGSNLFGQLGTSDTTFRNSPVQIGTDSNWASVTAGEFHTIGVKSDRIFYCGTGFNFYGQLGNGTTIDTNRFVCNTQGTPNGLKIETRESQSLSIFPNPNNGSFTVYAPGEGNGIYYVINELGQIVRTFGLNMGNNYTENIQGLNNGMYFIVGYNQFRSVGQKVVVTE